MEDFSTAQVGMQAPACLAKVSAFLATDPPLTQPWSPAEIDPFLSASTEHLILCYCILAVLY